MRPYTPRNPALRRRKPCESSPREQFLKLQEKVGENTVIFPNESPVGLDTAHIRARLDLLVYAYAENPQLVSDWLEALTWAEIQRVHETADASLSPVALVYSAIANTDRIMFSPEFLRREFFPRVKKPVDAWHKHGIEVIYRSDGNLWLVLDDFHKCGIDGINPLEPPSKMYAGRSPQSLSGLDPDRQHRRLTTATVWNQRRCPGRGKEDD